MDDPLLLPMFIMLGFLYTLNIIGAAFLFEHMDYAYGYNPNGMTKALRSMFWWFSLMLVGLVIVLSGMGRSKGDYYG